MVSQTTSAHFATGASTPNPANTVTLDVDPDTIRTALELAGGAGWNHDTSNPGEHLI